MRINLPTRRRLFTHVKYSVLLAIPLLAMGEWIVHKDPVKDRAEDYLVSNQEIVRAVGVIDNINMYNATYVKDAISHSGINKPGYNLYRYKIIGSKNNGDATVRVDKPETNHEEFSVSVKYSR